MKKTLSMLALAAMMLSVSSCSKDNVEEPENGKVTTVQLAVELPEGISARAPKANGPKRAYADGTTATTLQYAVYEQGKTTPLAIIKGDDGNYTDLGKKTINLNTTVQLQLVTGKTYDIVFWAANENAPYTFDKGNQTVTIDYNKVNANDESLDAFFRCYTYTTGTVVEDPIKLYRPFAQLNVGTADLATATAAGLKVDAAKTKVVVDGIYDAFNLKDGKVVGDAQKHEFALNAIPTNEKFPKSGYEYLSMDYLLVNEKKTVDVDWNIEDGSGYTKAHLFANVPVQRNYRTNIFGNLLTSTYDFNVEIVPAFKTPDYDAYYTVSTADQLKQILADATAQNVTVNVKGTLVIPDEFVTLGNDGTKEITLVGEGNGATIDFTNSYLSRIQMKNEAGKLHFKNLTLKNSVRLPGTWDVYDINFYKTSVTFEGVTFAKSISLDPAGNTGFEVSMKNCTITETVNDSYALWICAGAKVNIDGCKIDGPRAIKISDQYHKEGALITTLACNDCAFKSAKKAAVLVGSNAGANITFTGTTDITGVAADNVNAVWNDSDYKAYYDKVTVTGATMVQE